MEITEIKNCRVCGSENLKLILSLGNQYVTNFINSEEEQKGKVPLDLVLCENCKLLQLKHNAPPELMWNEQYWYKSGISTTIKNDLKDIVEKTKQLVELEEGSIVVDIGCNDGTLLGFYDREDIAKVGFEPSKNVAREAREKGFNVINNFFNSENMEKDFGDKRAKIITAISMFYDLEDPNQFLSDIVRVLDRNGVFVIQQNYLATMLQYNAFDNICHEHREYYTFTSLKNVLEKHGLEIFDVEQSTINGGSIRTYIRLKGNDKIKPFEGAEQRIKDIIEMERRMELDTMKPYLEFASRINKIKDDLMNFLRQERAKGKKIWIYGASTRGNVILQYFNLTTELIEAIADKNTDKHGKKTIGTLIPITSPEEMRKANPDYLLVNTWHFFDEIVNQEKEYFDKGGILIAPLPNFRIVERDIA